MVERFVQTNCSADDALALCMVQRENEELGLEAKGGSGSALQCWSAHPPTGGTSAQPALPSRPQATISPHTKLFPLESTCNWVTPKAAVHFNWLVTFLQNKKTSSVILYSSQLVSFPWYQGSENPCLSHNLFLATPQHKPAPLGPGSQGWRGKSRDSTRKIFPGP